MTGTSPHPDVSRGANAVGGASLPRGRMESAEAPTQIGPAALLPRAMIEVPPSAPSRPAVLNPLPSSSGAKPPATESTGRYTQLVVGGILGAAVLIGGTVYAAVMFARTPVIITAKSGTAQSGTATEENRVPGAHSATVDDGGGMIACLQDSTQIISSDRRDSLLLDAIKSFADGRYDSAQSSLKEYTQEACDRASYEALRIIEQRVGLPMREQ